MKYGVSLAYDYNDKQILEGEDKSTFIKQFQATADDAEMRKAFAASLSVPVLQTVAPQTSVRDIFAVDEIPNGALAEYPIDMEHINEAVYMPRLGQVPQNIVVGDSLIVPTFEVSNSVEWKLTFVRDGRYNIVERALTRLSESFIKAEERAGWDTIRGAINAENTMDTAETYLSKELFNDMITEMRQVQGYEPGDIYVSPRRAKDIRGWADTDVDPVTRREIFQAGGLGSIWNVEIHELRNLNDDEVFLFDTSRFGVMPIRTSLQTADIPTAIERLRAGVLAWEEIGFAVIDKEAMLYTSGLQ